MTSSAATGIAICAALIFGSAEAAAAQSGAPRALAAWTLRVTAGAGIGSRELELPADGVTYRTRTGAFPVAALGFDLGHRWSDAWELALVVRYASSLGLRIVEQLTDGSEHERDTRLHQLDLALAPVVALDKGGRWRLRVALGYGLADFRPEGHLVTPAYYLAGPLVRLELELPIWSERLRLRVAPEARFIAQVGDELVQRGAAASGIAAGASADLELLLGRWIAAVGYREQRSWLGSSQRGSLLEATRLVIAQLTGVL